MFSAEGTHSSTLWAHPGCAPSAASKPTAASTLFIVSASRTKMFDLERCPDAEGEEAHLIERDVRHLAELRTGRVQRRPDPLLAIEDVLRVDAHLHGPRAAGAEAALGRQVGKRQRHAAHAVDAEREGALLERRRRLGRVALEPGVDVEPALARGVVDVDVVEVAAKENILGPPVEERAGLELPRAGDLPVARQRRGDTTVGQHRLALAEGQLVARSPGEPPGARVVAALPERRLPLVLFHGAVDSDRVEVE